MEEIEKIYTLDEKTIEKIEEITSELNIISLKKVCGNKIIPIAQEFILHEFFREHIKYASSDCFCGVKLEEGNFNLYSYKSFTTVMKFHCQDNIVLIEGNREDEPSIKITILGEEPSEYCSEISSLTNENGIKTRKTIKRIVKGRNIIEFKPTYTELGKAKVM